MPSATRLRSCCFCINMELGLKILGYVEAILSGLAALSVILYTTGVIEFTKEESMDMPNTLKETIQVILELLIAIIAAGLLLYGVYRRQTNALQWTLTIRYVLIVGTIIGIVIMFFNVFSSELLGSYIFYILIQGYFCWVIYSYRADLMDSKVSTTAA